MKHNTPHTQLEPQVTAPKELKRKTFKKIEQLNIILELLGFYSSIPCTFLWDRTQKRERINKN